MPKRHVDLERMKRVLDRYNYECANGINHRPEWHARMARYKEELTRNAAYMDAEKPVNTHDWVTHTWETSVGRYRARHHADKEHCPGCPIPA